MGKYPLNSLIIFRQKSKIKVNKGKVNKLIKNYCHCEARNRRVDFSLPILNEGKGCSDRVQFIALK